MDREKCEHCRRPLPTKHEWDTLTGGEDIDPPGCWGHDCESAAEECRAAELQALREVAERAREVPRSRWTEGLHAALARLEEVSRG